MRIAVSLVLIVGVVVLAGCGGGSSAPGKATAFVVLVTDINQLNDHGFNQLAYQGLKRAEKDLGIRGDVYQSASAQAYIPNLSTAARKNADLVVAVGFDQAAAVAKVAKEFPKTHFAIIDVSQGDLAGKPGMSRASSSASRRSATSPGTSRDSRRSGPGRRTRSARSAARSSHRSTATSRATRQGRARPIRPSSS
jgi:hypothetical protein